jgi:hypothetical protein
MFFNLSRNQYQLSPFSPSTNAMTKGSNWLLLLAATTIRIVPLYLPVRKVPSMQMTGRQNLKAWMQAPNAKNYCWSTSLTDFSTQG